MNKFQEHEIPDNLVIYFSIIKKNYIFLKNYRFFI